MRRGKEDFDRVQEGRRAKTVKLLISEMLLKL